jgi:hypothetical protein
VGSEYSLLILMELERLAASPHTAEVAVYPGLFTRFVRRTSSPSYRVSIRASEQPQSIKGIRLRSK